MKQLLIQLRTMQLFTHGAHNLCSKVLFFQDHDFFGSVYTVLEGDYDSVLERMIGLHGEESLDYPNLLNAIATKLKPLPSVGVKENSEFFKALLTLEVELCSLIKQTIAKGTTPGTEQLIGEIANQSEMRQYKIKQRIKK